MHPHALAVRAARMLAQSEVPSTSARGGRATICHPPTPLIPQAGQLPPRCRGSPRITLGSRASPAQCRGCPRISGCSQTPQAHTAEARATVGVDGSPSTDPRCPCGSACRGCPRITGCPQTPQTHTAEARASVGVHGSPVSTAPPPIRHVLGVQASLRIRMSWVSTDPLGVHRSTLGVHRSTDPHGSAGCSGVRARATPQWQSGSHGLTSSVGAARALSPSSGP